MLRHGKVGFFDNLSEVAVISLSTMVYCYAQNGFGRKALALFEIMINLGLQPNDVTVLSVLLACNNSGEEGCEFFDSFRKDKITIELEYKRGEIGNVSGIPEEHLSRKVIIYSPARTATQQGSGKLGKWKINFVSTLKWENPLMGWTSSTGEPYANVGDSALAFDSEEAAKCFLLFFIFYLFILVAIRIL
ncbi:unnamed protein product [Arabidopsis lyrata]|nr:unnamed protein product [Arabidopsis lyrata]